MKLSELLSQIFPKGIEPSQYMSLDTLANLIDGAAATSPAPAQQTQEPKTKQGRDSGRAPTLGMSEIILNALEGGPKTSRQLAKIVSMETHRRINSKQINWSISGLRGKRYQIASTGHRGRIVYVLNKSDAQDDIEKPDRQGMRHVISEALSAKSMTSDELVEHLRTAGIRGLSSRDVSSTIWDMKRDGSPIESVRVGRRALYSMKSQAPQ